MGRDSRDGWGLRGIPGPHTSVLTWDGPRDSAVGPHPRLGLLPQGEGLPSERRTTAEDRRSARPGELAPPPRTSAPTPGLSTLRETKSSSIALSLGLPATPPGWPSEHGGRAGLAPGGGSAG